MAYICLALNKQAVCTVHPFLSTAFEIPGRDHLRTGDFFIDAVLVLGLHRAMTRPTPLDELRKKPCVHGHTRLDAYEVMAKDGPELRCRQCVRESNRRRKIAERQSRAWRTWSTGSDEHRRDQGRES